MTTPADIAIYGGAAGGGKSYALLLDPLRYLNVPGFGYVIFRRTSPQITNEGGLWDTSAAIYPFLRARPLKDPHSWRFPGNVSCQFSHLQYESDIYGWQGAQVPWIGFDELTHFTYKQFFYMLSRNRSPTGVPGCIRATCNPDPDSWVADFIAWWIEQDETSPNYGYPIAARSGKLRWFIRSGNELIWADTRQELIEKYGEEQLPKSVTFIPSSIFDNKKLLERDPAYLANLHALPLVERMQLLAGNWKVRASAGIMFKKSWFEIVDAVPKIIARVRYWDRAATEKIEGNNPDWTAGLCMSVAENRQYYIEDMARDRCNPLGVERLVKNTASADGQNTEIAIEQDPGQAGKAEAASYVRLLAGYNVRVYPVNKDKVTRAKPMSAQAEAGNIKVLRGPWNKAFFDEYEAFPTKGVKDDQVDAGSGAFGVLSKRFFKQPRISIL